MNSKEWSAFIWDTVIVLVLFGIGLAITKLGWSDYFVICIGIWLICLLFYLNKKIDHKDKVGLEGIALLIADLIIVKVIALVVFILIYLGISVYFMWACLLFVAYLALTVAYKND